MVFQSSRSICTVQSITKLSQYITNRNRHISRQFGSSNNNKNGIEELPTPGTNTYVHPLSQIVLEHLQSTRSSFLIETGLDTGLKINKDGTFTLHFPKEAQDENDSKIWTSYDSEESKHWLDIKKGDLIGRYLLQDNLKPAWHSSKLSTPEKVQGAVDQMILKIQEKK